MRVICEVSARHYHPALELREDLSKKRDLSQPGQWLAHEKMTQGLYEFAIIMPPRTDGDYYELSITDCYQMRIKPSFQGKYRIQQRHFHCSEENAIKLSLKEGQLVSIYKDGERAGRLDAVKVRISHDFIDRIHLDTDEANALLIKNGDEVELII